MEEQISKNSMTSSWKTMFKLRTNLTKCVLTVTLMLLSRRFSDLTFNNIMEFQSRISRSLIELADHPLCDQTSNDKMNKILLLYYQSIIGNAQTQPSLEDSFRFLNDMNGLQKWPSLVKMELLKELGAKKQIEHIYITQMMRLSKKEEQSLAPDAAIVFAKLYKTYPYLLKHQMPNLSTINGGMFCDRSALLRLQENVWHLNMQKGRGQAIKWYIMSGLTLFALFNVWVLYKRVKFYMEHSFDILNPDIDYLIKRY